MSSSDYGSDFHLIADRYPALKSYVLDFAPYVKEKTGGFVGREFVFERVQGFIEQNDRGYLRIVADAGIGKTSIAAALAQRYRAVAHFFDAQMGFTDPEIGLTHLAVCLVSRFALPYEFIPHRTGVGAPFLAEVLERASRQQTDGDPIVLVIDALDQATPAPLGFNWLNLPDADEAQV